MHLAEHEISKSHRKAVVAYITRSANKRLIDSELKRQFAMAKQGMPFCGHSHSNVDECAQIQAWRAGVQHGLLISFFKHTLVNSPINARFSECVCVCVSKLCWTLDMRDWTWTPLM